eukprot:648082-Prorocentrum_minimum.AAC.1
MELQVRQHLADAVPGRHGRNRSHPHGPLLRARSALQGGLRELPLECGHARHGGDRARGGGELFPLRR